MELHGLDLLLWDGTINTFKMNHSVPSFAMATGTGNPVPTGYGTGTGSGMWMGKDVDGVYKFRVGTPGAAGMFWDGTALTITGVSGGALTGIPAGGAASDVNTYSTTINGGKITTGSITANKLVITSNGAALNQDPGFLDLTMWSVYQGTRSPANTGHGAYVFQSASSASYCQVTANDYVVIDRVKKYRVSAWAVKDTGNTGILGIGVVEYDGNKAVIQGTRTDFPTTAVSTGWLQFTITLPALQSATAFVQVYAVLNNTGTVGQQYIADLRLEEMLPSTLIMDGAITTAKITAGAITTDKLFVGNDAALNDDPSCADASAWTLTNVAIGLSSYGSPHCLLSTSGVSGTALGAKLIPVSAAKTYRLHCYALRSSDANGQLYVGLYYLDYQGNQLTYNYPCAPGIAPGTGWGTYEGALSVANGLLPSNAVNVRLIVYPNYGATAGYMAVTDVRLEEMSPSTLIQDGAITTNKLTANAVSAGQINAGAVTAGTIAANAVTAGTVNAGVVTTREIASRTIVAGNIASGTITANELTAHTITAHEINVSQLSAIAADLGTITAGSVSAITISASTISGNTITGGSISGTTITGNTISGGTITGTTINGSTIHAGSGNEVTLDGSGITVAGGTGANNRYKFTSGSYVQGQQPGSADLVLYGAQNLVMSTGNGLGLALGSGAWYPYNSGPVSLGTSGSPWVDVFASGTVTANALHQTTWPAGSNLAVHVLANGFLVANPSSLRYKEQIRPWDATQHRARAILSAQPILFDYLGPPVGSGQKDLLGFSAEDLYAIDPHLAVLDQDGLPLGIHTDALLAHLLVALQDMDRRLTALEGHA